MAGSRTSGKISRRRRGGRKNDTMIKKLTAGLLAAAMTVGLSGCTLGTTSWILRYGEDNAEVPTGIYVQNMYTAYQAATKYDAFDFLLLTDETETETVELCGNLCTGTDIMASALTLPRAKVGDILVVTKAGSYAYVLTPVQFSSQPVPEQFLLTADGRFLDR